MEYLGFVCEGLARRSFVRKAATVVAASNEVKLLGQDSAVLQTLADEAARRLETLDDGVERATAWFKKLWRSSAPQAAAPPVAEAEPAS